MKSWEIIKKTYVFDKYKRTLIWKADNEHYKYYASEEACLDALRDLRNQYSKKRDYPSFGKGPEEEAKYPHITPQYWFYRYFHKKRKINNEEYRKLCEDILDVLYEVYESENSLQNVAYTHPMFYNGTFSENNSYQPPKPEELLTKEEFINKLYQSPDNDRWVTAFQALVHYELLKFDF